MRLSLTFASAIALFSLLAACSKDPPPVDDQSGTSPLQLPGTATAPTTALPDQTGMAKPDDAGAAPAASTEATATAVATAKTTAPTTSASAVVTNCGSKQNPCPLQKWMKQHTQADLSAGDNAAIAGDLEKIAAMAPDGYSKWASIAKDGATAARAANTDAVKASCRGCHDDYKTKYKTEMRGRAVPGA
ncbi:MAG: hypothetical protein ABI551_25505 [Polyangiaceae bacterium]